VTSETRTITVKKELVYEVALVRKTIGEDAPLQAVVDFVIDLVDWEDQTYFRSSDAYTFDYLSDNGEHL